MRKDSGKKPAVKAAAVVKKAESDSEVKPINASDDDTTDIDIEEEESDSNNKDNKFETFIKVCNKIAAQAGHLAKTNVLREFITKGTDGKKYKGDLSLFIHLLLPNSKNRVYNLNSTSFVKLFSKLFKVDQDDMTNYLNQSGEISDTIKNFFEESTSMRPQKTPKLTIQEIDAYLDELTTITKEQEQFDYLRKVSLKCTADELQMIIRMIKKDLRINAGEKVLLEAITPNAYDAFKVSRDLDDVIKRSIKLLKDSKPGLKKDLSIKITLMKAVKPMLADACKSAEAAFKKCPNGIYAEIKYDGERLQVHKNGNKFEYYSRNLKPVQAHKVSHLKEFIPKAFPNANDLILDSEVLLYDHKTKKPLPFGSLGVHKVN